MNASLLLSIVAVAISLFTLVWHLQRSRWERPVVVVTGRVVRTFKPSLNDDDGVELGDPEWSFELTVVNVGERPVTLTGWGWRFGSRTYLIDFRRDNNAPPFPLRLETHDTRTWSVRREPTDRIKAGDSVRPHVVLVERPRLFTKRQDRGLRAVPGPLIPLPDGLRGDGLTAEELDGT